LDKKQKHQALQESPDENLFRQSVDGVVPLKTAARSDSKPPSQASRKRRQESVQRLADPATELLQDYDIAHHREADSSHRKNGVQLKVMQKLKRGHFPPADQFDLHHLNTRTGKAELLKFIAAASRQGLQSIRIIHGKGLRSKQGPKLKLMTRQVLRDHPQVLAYTACKPADGGDGASDVLLKQGGS